MENEEVKDETATPAEEPTSSIPDFLLSSTGDGFSMRAKALIPALVPIISVIAALFGHQIDKGSIVQLLESLCTTAALIMFIVGWVRAEVYKAHGLGYFSK